MVQTGPHSTPEVHRMRFKKFVVAAGSALALAAAKMDAIAAADPETGSYVAALYIPGTQILVVSGKFGDDFLGPHRLSKKEYRELYMDLQGASVAGSKLFAQDAGANGFVLKPTGGA